MSSGLFDLLAHVIFTVKVEYISDQIKRMLVVMHFSVETSEIEAISDVFFVDFAKIFIASG